MCGIMGYVGKENSVKIVGEGLSALEYRGYDSAGVCAVTEKGMEIVKTVDRVSVLEKKAEKNLGLSHCAIGHTRWATHGSVNEANAHPHRVGAVCLVHNGIIENYRELKERYFKDGTASQTDTEVACGVINSHFLKTGEPFSAISRALGELVGTYAFGIIFEGIENKIYAVRKGSPLVVGCDGSGSYLASDIGALVPYTQEYYDLEEGEIAELTREGVRVSGKEKIEYKRTSLSPEELKKGGYEHFMLKEMMEQENALRACLSPRIKDGLPDFECDGIEGKFIEGIEEIHIVACGSAMHAGLLGGAIIERYGGVPVRVFVASEYRYSPPAYRGKPLVVLVSQSGETADTIACLRYAKERGLDTLGIVNAVESTIAKESDFCAYTHAGKEIAVATTKGYITQVALLILLGISIGYEQGKIEGEKAKSLTECLFFQCPSSIKSAFEQEKALSEAAEVLAIQRDAFYIGRGVGCALAMEGALKVKEISYINAQAYGAGELKHGTISLIEKGTPVVAIATDGTLFDKLCSNIEEVKSRGAVSVVICPRGIARAESADYLIEYEADTELGGIFGAIAAVQMLAYLVARARGCDIDKPRNLAKSVTVE